MTADKDKVGKFFEFLQKAYDKFSGAQKFSEVKLKDGTQISYDGEMPVVGMPVMVIPSDGTAPIPPADGVLICEDGTEIEVKDGVIMNVKPVATATPPAPNEMGDKTPVTEQAAKRLIESHVKETVYSKTEVDEAIKKNSEEITKALEEKFTAMNSLNETLKKEVADSKAEAAKISSEFEKHKAFAAELKTALAEYGTKPQVTETEEEKKKKAEAFQRENKPAKQLTPEEFRKKYNLG
jgi:hypothetical protein